MGSRGHAREVMQKAESKAREEHLRPNNIPHLCEEHKTG